MIKNTIVLFLVFTSTVVLAAPPRNVVLAYNAETKKLSIKADHQTDRPDRYFIRMLTVKSNLQDEKDMYYNRQSSPTDFSEELDYTASPGEHLDVSLYASEGGMAGAFIDIPKDKEDEKKDK